MTEIDVEFECSDTIYSTHDYDWHYNNSVSPTQPCPECERIMYAWGGDLFHPGNTTDPSIHSDMVGMRGAQLVSVSGDLEVKCQVCGWREDQLINDTDDTCGRLVTSVTFGPMLKDGTTFDESVIDGYAVFVVDNCEKSLYASTRWSERVAYVPKDTLTPNPADANECACDGGSKYTVEINASISMDTPQRLTVVPVMSCADETAVPSGSAWTDASGNTCEDYSRNHWCSPSGGLGYAWSSQDWGPFDASFNGHTAAEACCECGGGDVAFGGPLPLGVSTELIVDNCTFVDVITTTQPTFVVSGTLSLQAEGSQEAVENAMLVALAAFFGVPVSWIQVSATPLPNRRLADRQLQNGGVQQWSCSYYGIFDDPDRAAQMLEAAKSMVADPSGLVLALKAAFYPGEQSDTTHVFNLQVDEPTASGAATAKPTGAPTPAPPTQAPTAAPSAAPSAAPTAEPTGVPTSAPTPRPTSQPTLVPGETAAPTSSPTPAPPTPAPPTDSPTPAPPPTAPTPAPPSTAPAAAPPTRAPTAEPTDVPTDEPTASPSAETTPQPPTAAPTGAPTRETDGIGGARVDPAASSAVSTEASSTTTVLILGIAAFVVVFIAVLIPTVCRRRCMSLLGLKRGNNNNVPAAMLAEPVPGSHEWDVDDRRQEEAPQVNATLGVALGSGLAAGGGRTGADSEGPVAEREGPEWI